MYENKRNTAKEKVKENKKFPYKRGGHNRTKKISTTKRGT